MVDSAKKTHFQDYHFSHRLCWPGVLNKDPTVCPDEARPHPKYICKYLKIKIDDSYINNIIFGKKIFTDRKLK
jgi:hypothetical protein